MPMIPSAGGEVHTLYMPMQIYFNPVYLQRSSGLCKDYFCRDESSEIHMYAYVYISEISHNGLSTQSSACMFNFKKTFIGISLKSYLIA
jgi:hypothetical protein